MKATANNTGRPRQDGKPCAGCDVHKTHATFQTGPAVVSLVMTAAGSADYSTGSPLRRPHVQGVDADILTQVTTPLVHRLNGRQDVGNDRRDMQAESGFRDTAVSGSSGKYGQLRSRNIPKRTQEVISPAQCKLNVNLRG